MMKRLAILIALCLAGPALAQTINAQTTAITVVIAAGNTFQTLFAALGVPPAIRRSMTIENNNATDSCWLFIGSGAATKATSILLLPGGSYTRYYPYVPSDAIQATCTTTADTMYADTQ